jgi:hypothetical protein
VIANHKRIKRLMREHDLQPRRRRPSVCPFDQGEVIAAWTAASSFITPRANESTRLARTRSIQGNSSALALRRIIKWNSAMISRASTRVGTLPSIAATVMTGRDYDLEWPPARVGEHVDLGG